MLLDLAADQDLGWCTTTRYEGEGEGEAAEFKKSGNHRD